MELSDKQASFVRYLVLDGCSPTEAARRANYAQPKQRAWELLQRNTVQAAIRAERTRVIGSDLANVAVKTLRDIMTDDKAPAAARVSAARTSLEMAGHLGPTGKEMDDKPIAEMSQAELQELVDKARAAVAQKKAEQEIFGEPPSIR